MIDAAVEDKKYSDLYNGQYGRDTFRHLEVLQKFMKFKDKKIIDVGCGTGWLRNKVPHGGYIGVDVASVFEDRSKTWADNEIFIHGDVRHLTIRQKADISISLDLMEHLEEEAIDSVIKNILAWGKESVIGIACFPHVHNKQKLHLTVKPPVWWRNRIEKFTKIAAEYVTQNYCMYFISERDLNVIANIPYAIGGIRVMHSELDGSFFIPRKNKVAEAYLDKVGHRCPNQLKWYVPLSGVDLKFTETCYIVGKGPSLDHLRKEHFHPGCSVLCLNEAVHKVVSLGLDNPLYMFQQDEGIGTTPHSPGVHCILSTKLRKHYKDIPNTTFIHPRSVGPTASVITAIFAMNTAQSFGCHNFKLMCFDGCVNKKTNYALCIGHDSILGGRPERFLGHKNLIIQAAKLDSLEWIIPEEEPCSSVTSSEKDQASISLE